MLAYIMYNQLIYILTNSLFKIDGVLWWLCLTYLFRKQMYGVFCPLSNFTMLLILLFQYAQGEDVNILEILS